MNFDLFEFVFLKHVGVYNFVYFDFNFECGNACKI